MTHSSEIEIINNGHKQRKRAFAIPSSVRKYLMNYKATIRNPYSSFYLLAKIHKTPWKTRPVVSTCGSTLYAISKWLHVILHDICVQLPFFVKDSAEIVRDIKKLKLTPNSKVFTADAVSMYTNINTTHALSVISKFLYNPPEYITMPDVHVKYILCALEFVMKNNIFNF